jgi:ubiquitin-conjugating enzyme E2 O
MPTHFIHHFTGATHFVNQVSRSIQLEWKKLKDNLPDGVHVVTYENHIDLLKVLIVGAPNTVYCHSYFLFDVIFPNDYPFSPPKVFYHAYGHNLNPNLQVDGNVCLSLLGTWSGESNERWIAKKSSLLQVVVSIQGLVLGSKEPYFLEAGFEKFRGTKQGIASSLMYQEKALLLSLKHMISVANHPPQEFTDILQKVFKANLPDVLKFADLCADALQSKDGSESAEFAAMREKFSLHAEPSRGFLLPIAEELRQALVKLQDKK